MSNTDTVQSVIDILQSNVDGEITNVYPVTVEEAIYDSETGVNFKDKMAIRDSSLSNPNLLINPDFRINQRGKTEYSIDWNSQLLYTVDRWAIIGISTVAIEDEYILFSSNIIYAQFLQYTEINIQEEKTYTVSIDCETISGEFYIEVQDYKTNYTQLGYAFVPNSGRNTVTFNVTIPKNAGVIVKLVSNRDGEENSIKIYNAKMELGSLATPFIPPNPWEELMKCGIPDNSSTYGYTQAVPNSLPSTGGTVTDNIAVQKSALPTINLKTNKAFSSIYRNASDTVEDGLRITDYSDISDTTHSTIFKIKDIANLVNAITLEKIVDSKSYNYKIFGEHNKPTGTYTGLGNATERRFYLGGIVKGVLISSTSGVALVFPQGAIIAFGTTVYASTELKIDGEYLVVSVDTKYFNTLNASYLWQVI